MKSQASFFLATKALSNCAISVKDSEAIIKEEFNREIVSVEII